MIAQLFMGPDFMYGMFRLAKHFCFFYSRTTSRRKWRPTAECKQARMLV